MISFFKTLFGKKPIVKIKADNNEEGEENDNMKDIKEGMREEITNDIERLFVEGIDEEEKRKDFYKLFLKTKFYFLGELEGDFEKGEDGSVIAGKNSKIKLPAFNINNQPMYPFFTSLEKLNEGVKNIPSKKYFQCKFSDFFNKQIQNLPFIMNPGSLIVNIFPPQKIKSILDGSILKGEVEIKSGTKLSIGIPANKPQKFLDKLIDYAQSEDVIKEVYLAQLYDEANGDRAVIAIEFAKGVTEKRIYFEKIGSFAQGNLEKDQFIDFMEITQSNEISQIIKLQGERIL